MKSKMMIACCIGLLSLLAIGPVTSYAEIPKQINYQGYLTDSDGNPADGDYEMSFAIYDTPTGPTPLWAEDQTVTVTNGIYDVILGQPGNLIEPDILDDNRYLGVRVLPDTAEMTPRQKITATAFTLKAAKAEDADTLDGKDSVALDQSAHVSRTDNPHSVTAEQTGAASMSDITWDNLSNIPADFADGVDDIGIETETDPTILDPSIKDGVSWGELSGIPSGFLDGIDNVGMNTSEDYGRSGVASNLYEGSYTLTSRYLNDDRAETIRANTTANLLSVFQDGTGKAIDAETDGSMGIRSISNGTDGLGVAGYCHTSGGTGILGQGDSNGVYGWGIGASGTGVYGKASGSSGYGVYGEAEKDGYCRNYGGYFIAAGEIGRGVAGKATGASGIGMYGKAEGASGIGVFGEAPNTGYAGYFKGNVRVEVLEITGGSDIAEPFAIQKPDSTIEGAVMVIDPDNPGKLKISSRSYDRRVAGIVSGAGGVNPGMLMAQKGSAADGTTPIALTGRVYCLADASGGSIEPGDLLTTSNTPGHAMKVKDYGNAQGAILGKAMSSLDQGRGLVLVLVTLQ